MAILTRDTGNRSDRITSCLPIIWDLGQLGCLSRDGPEAQRGPRQLQRLEFGSAREYHLWNREHRDRNCQSDCGAERQHNSRSAAKAINDRRGVVKTEMLVVEIGPMTLCVSHFDFSIAQVASKSLVCHL